MQEANLGNKIRQAIIFRCSNCKSITLPVILPDGEYRQPKYCSQCGRTEGNILKEVARLKHNACPVCLANLTINVARKDIANV